VEKRLTLKTSVKHVKFSPEEMAYDAPADASHWGPSIRGLKAFRAYLRQRRKKKEVATTGAVEQHRKL